MIAPLDRATAVAHPDSAHAQSTDKPRLFYLDNLRTGMIALVVAGHLAVSYGAEGDWYDHGEGQASAAAYILMLPLMALGAAFMLGLLFFVAGYFTPRSLDRKGAGRFLADRLKRLGIPLVLFAVVINPLNNFLVDRATGAYSGPLWTFLPAFWRNTESSGVGVMWFVEALLLFSVGYVAWRLLTRGRATPAESAALPGNRAVLLFAVGLGVVTFVVRLWAPVNRFFEPEHLEYAHFPQYIAFFAAGVVAYRRNWLLRFADAQVRLWHWIAVGCVLFLPVLVALAGGFSGELNPDGAGGLNWLSLVYSLWEGVTGVALAMVVLAWVRARFDRQGRLARAMSDASFAAYFLHPLVIVCLALALRWVPLEPSVEFAVMLLPAIALCFLAGHLVRKAPGLRGIL